MISDIKIKCTAWISVLCFAALISCRGQVEHDPWAKARSIASEIAHTFFPEQVYLITDFGAIADDGYTDLEAIKQAINRCAAQGGGRVMIPSGVFLTGPLTLPSNVNLHLETGAVLEFSTRPEDYLPVVRTRWEGMDCFNYSPLIYAFKARNIAITGKGILDGRAGDTEWWSWKGRKEFGWKEGMPSQEDPGGRPRLLGMMENGTDVEKRMMGKNAYLRPPFIQFFQCNTVLVEDVTIKNSPFWLIHPVLTENIIIRRVSADSHGPNNDGCNPESCRNVFVENCLMDSPELDRAIRIKTNSFRGGTIENLFVRNLEIGQVDEAVIKINCHYEIKDGELGEYLPLVRNILIEDISSKESKYAIFIQGIEGQDVIRDIRIRNARFNGVKEGNFIRSTDNPSMDEVYINNVLAGE